MFSTTDTIVAIATPPGRGGLGVVRISGAEASAIAQVLTSRAAPFAPRHATLATITTSSGILDRVIVTMFAAPHSYTGEDVAEISAHGSPVVLRAIVGEAMQHGARLAEPGEFTLRAYLNQRVDLVQAEAVRDLIDSVTPLQARTAFDQLEGTLTGSIAAIDRALFDLAARLEASLDFPDEGYHFVEGDAAVVEIDAVLAGVTDLLSTVTHGRLIRDGVQVVITGRPNTGKSSLFNLLAGAGRAIVTDVPGTTRDLLTEVVDIDGVPITFVDTAGSREVPADTIEAEGIARAAAARQVASVIVLVLDGSAPLTDDDQALLRETADQPRVLVVNKADLPSAWALKDDRSSSLKMSALTGEGLQEFRETLSKALGGGELRRDVPTVTNLRHADLLTRAHAALERARGAAAARAPEEFLLADLNEARSLLEEVTGSRSAEDVLAHIFSRFCIGK